MAHAPPVVLTVAGFDPSSGAGVTADIKTIAAHGCYGVACITALTVQSTQGVSRVKPLDPVFISGTLEELAADVDLAAVKIGMLGSAKIVSAVADFLKGQGASNVVLDPILKSSSGTALLDRPGQDLLLQRLLPLVTVVTPNLEEASVLTGQPVRNQDEMKAAAMRLHEHGVRHVVVTGGHLEKAADLLSFTTPAGKIEQEVFKAERQRSRSTHGTGCAFATALACHLAHGRQIPEAVLLAKAFITAAISNAYPVGRGVGPVHHLYRMYERPRRTVTAPDTDMSAD